jgi:riboflavin kinase / FMN adenylyltransferase
VRAPGRFRVFRGDEGVAELFGASVVAFGKFDGVHRGHRALLERALASGRRLGLPVGAVTFERHPHAYLRGGRLPPALTGLGDRLRLLRDAGVAFVVLLPTDATLLGLAAEDFARQVLRARMRIRLVVGENFRFGRGGAGDAGTLRRLVSTTGLDAVELAMASVDGEVVSATRIREPLAHGDVGRAGDLLGRPYDVVGRLSGTTRPCLIRISPMRALPAPGRYRASIGPVRPGDRWTTAAVVAVHPCGERQHHLEVELPENGLPAGAAGHGVRVMFEGTGRGPGGASRGG